jgi:homoserine dehydrogenase
VLELGRDIVASRPPLAVASLAPAQVAPAASHRSRYYMRLTVPDQAGVLAQIAGALGERDVSIASVLQFEDDEDAGTAELVLTTHLAAGGALLEALHQIEQAQVVQRIGNVLPIAGVGGAR